ncbi:hypothetical protein [Cognatishimia maritima]|uniref:Uncharacterized protein n=1 Tax=Cognatishimia maritima TaxID=870908 RepID=A0A1M5KMR9_9RHOB|nr:hypothetical protein [Cognatishimia maritima]SHG53990.1 hypothetical protein SAMN04488044_1019 [Cognatishimia maritima]
MRHAYVWGAALIVLGACATPREQCEARVDRDITQLKQAIAISEGNIARGYALREDVTPRLRYGLCTGGGNVQSCLRTEHQTKTVPVAIDLEEEARKLASAKRRLAQEERANSAALAQCAAAYPET